MTNRGPWLKTSSARIRAGDPRLAQSGEVGDSLRAATFGAEAMPPVTAHRADPDNLFFDSFDRANGPPGSAYTDYLGNPLGAISGGALVLPSGSFVRVVQELPEEWTITANLWTAASSTRSHGFRVHSADGLHYIQVLITLSDAFSHTGVQVELYPGDSGPAEYYQIDLNESPVPNSWTPIEIIQTRGSGGPNLNVRVGGRSMIDLYGLYAPAHPRLSIGGYFDNTWIDNLAIRELRTLTNTRLISDTDVVVGASLSKTTAGATLSASAEVVEGGTDITATLASTLEAAALSATAATRIAGSVSSTLGSASLASSAGVVIRAVTVDLSGGIATGPAALAASAGLRVAGSLTATLQAAALSAASSVAVGGALTQALGTATLSSNVDVLVNGTLTAQLGNAGLSAQVGVGVGAALAAQLGEAALAAAGAVTVSAAVNATLEAAALAGTVDTSESISASLDAVLEDVGLLANADVIVNVLGAERFVDDFNRADGPVGSNYDPHPLFWIGQTLPDITGNSVHGTSASSYRAAILQQPIGATQFARMRVRKPTTPSQNNSYRLFLRASAPEVSPALLLVQLSAFGTEDGNVQWFITLSGVDDAGNYSLYAFQAIGWSADEFVDFEASYDGTFVRGTAVGIGSLSYELGPVTYGDRVGFGFLLYDGEIDNFEAGYLGRQLSDATLSASADVVVSGAGYATFDNAVVSGAVAVNVTGSVSAVLDASTLAASADTILGASLAAQLGPATVSGIAQIRVTAQLAATLQAAALAGAADVVDRIAPSSGTTSSASDGPTLGYTARQTVEPGSGQIYIGSGMVVLADRLLQLTPESGSVRIRSGIDMAIGDQVDPVLPAMFIHLDGAMWVALDLPYLERALPAPTP